MTRKCEINNTGTRYGNNVSHSNKKTRRTFKTNIKIVTYNSNITNNQYKLKVSTRAMRSINKAGGFDQFILKKSLPMSNKIRKIKKKLLNHEKEHTPKLP